MTKTNIFDGERLHVMDGECSTCIFRQGNLMSLEPGRVSEMVRATRETGGVIPCHKTIHGEREQEVICRGWFDAHGYHNNVLRLAIAMDVIVFDSESTEQEKK